MSDDSNLPRQAWIAAVLSLLCTGLGHLYCGKGLKGLVLFLISLLFTPAVVLMSIAKPTMWILLGIILGALMTVVIYLYAAIDSFRMTRRLNPPYSRREYNHPAIYVLFLLVGVAYPIGSTWILRETVMEAFFVPASSMTPSVLKGDRVLVSKMVARRELPARGETIVFRPPGKREMRYIKRVIGLPGDTVAVQGDDVYVNGKPLERDRVPAARLSAIQRQATGPVFTETNAGHRYRVMLDVQSEARPDFPETTVPEDMIFVLGDNRHRSLDSRNFGCVPAGDLLGPVQYIYWPAETWRRFGVLGG